MTPGRRKISQMIWEFAGDFIRMGKTPAEQHIRLTAACAAWNIACTPPERRKAVLDDYMATCQRLSPRTDPVNSAAIRSDMEKLIERKVKLFPRDVRQIIGARLIPVGDQVRIEAAAATIGR